MAAAELALSALSLLRGRIEQRQAGLDQMVEREGTQGGMIASAELDEVLKIIDEEIERVKNAV